MRSSDPERGVVERAAPSARPVPAGTSGLAREAINPEARATVMRHANPAVIPRNHRVEAALAAAVAGDLEPLDTLLQALAHPWDPDPRFDEFRLPPAPHEVVQQTFCGT